MRPFLFLAGVACCAVVAGGSARGDDAATARAVIEKAFKATGGEEKITKYKGATFKGKGIFSGMGAEIPYSGEWWLQAPDQMKVVIKVDVNGMIFTMTRVYNGGKGWVQEGDQTREMTKDELAAVAEQMYEGWLTSLVPLLKDKAFTLTPVGEIQVDGKPAVGVQITQKGKPDVTLYFDKDKGLLVKSEMNVKDEGSGKEVRAENFYSQHKEVDGIQVPMKLKILRDGKDYVTADLSDYQNEEKIDDSTFAKP